MRGAWIRTVVAGVALMGLAVAPPSAFAARSKSPRQKASSTQPQSPLAQPQWTIQPSANPAGAQSASLSAVTCASDGTCMAVGSYSPEGKAQLSLAERWNGTEWTIVGTPNPPGTTDVLSSVSCPSPGTCFAVGYSSTSAHVRTLAETWSGGKWTVQPTPSTGSGSLASLSSISCTAPEACTAVGGVTKAGVEAQEQPLAEHWDGTSWTIQPTPNPEAENGSSLSGLSCTASNACTAGGNYVYGDVDQSVFAFRWNGSAWAQETQPNPGGENQNADNAVSCVGESFCVSVGSWVDTELETRPLAERWNGTRWSRQMPPHPRGAVGAPFNDVSCASSSQCTAVGEWSTNRNGIPSFPLAERWNGVAWKVQATPDPPGAELTALSGVYCAETCVAVGSSYNGSVTQTLVERSR